MRLIWPAPTPKVMPPAQKTIALLFTYWATVQANIRSCSSCAVGCLTVTIFRSAGLMWWLSAVCSRMPEPTRLLSPALRPCCHGVSPPGGSSICSRRALGLPREDRQRLGAEGRRHQHLDELPGHQLGRRLVDRAVEGNDAAEGTGRVGLEGLGITLGRIGTDGHAAGVGMLDDHAGRRVEALHAFPGRIGVGDVVVAELLALQLPARHQRAGRRVQVRGTGPRSGASSRRSAGPAA